MRGIFIKVTIYMYYVMKKTTVRATEKTTQMKSSNHNAIKVFRKP